MLNFGPVLFFLTLLQDNYEFEHHHEFMSYDGLSTCLVNSHEGCMQFDTFVYNGGSIEPNLQAVNEIKQIKYSRDALSINSGDQLTFVVNSRSVMKDNGIQEYLELSVKNAYLELLIEQWLHSLYLKPNPNIKVQTTDLQIKRYLELMIAAKV